MMTKSNIYDIRDELMNIYNPKTRKLVLDSFPTLFAINMFDKEEGDSVNAHVMKIKGNNGYFLLNMDNGSIIGGMFESIEKIIQSELDSLSDECYSDREFVKDMVVVYTKQDSIIEKDDDGDVRKTFVYSYGNVMNCYGKILDMPYDECTSIIYLRDGYFVVGKMFGEKNIRSTKYTIIRFSKNRKSLVKVFDDIWFDGLRGMCRYTDENYNEKMGFVVTSKWYSDKENRLAPYVIGDDGSTHYCELSNLKNYKKLASARG